MIEIRVLRDQQGYRKVVSNGHAGYGEEGEDIVCAAVSALLINTANSLEQLTAEDLVIEEDPEGGYLMMEFPDPLSERGTLLVDSLVLGLSMIAENYGDDFLTLIEQEAASE